MMKALNIIFLTLIMLSCEKEGTQPIGFFQTSYFTKSDEAQEFKYYYDDGEFVAGGLDQYMAAISSESGTFSSEELLMLKYTPEINSLVDSLIPFSYFMGMSYTGEINQAVEFRINYEYPYNNIAHEDFIETQFFLNNIGELRLLELSFQEGSEVYYDPDFIVSEIPFFLDEDTKDVVFSTDNPNSMFAFCWVEQPWQDTLIFEIPGSYSNTEEGIYGGIRQSSINAQGATFTSENIIHFIYNNNSLKSETNSNDQGWSVHQLDLIIRNPGLGLVDHENIDLDLLIGRNNSGTFQYTHLNLNSSTQVEFIKWPNYREYGELSFSGPMTLATDLSSPNTSFSIKFKRQR